MLTIAFIVLKLTNSLLLSWWWIILAIVIDGVVSGTVSNRIENAYIAGIEEAEEEKLEERE